MTTSASRRATVVRRVVSSLLPLWSVVVLVTIWEVWVVAKHYNAIVFPRPLDVARGFIENPGTYVRSLAVTVVLAVLGLALGMLSGALVAVGVSLSPILRGLAAPIALLLPAVPVVAMLPVIARLFGYNSRTELAITVIVCFFPTFVFTSSGLHRNPSGSQAVLAVLGANRRQRLRCLLLPSAIPNVATALRITAPLSVLAAMLGEFLMGTDGLGYFIAFARSDMDLVSSWAAAILGTLTSVGFFQLASAVERSVVRRWN